MTINTQKLREHAGNLKPPHLDVAIMLLGAADAYDAQAAEIDRLRNMAWTNGDVLKESQAEAVKLRAELAHLRAVLSQALMALEGYLPSHRNDVTDRAIAVARAALSGEGK